MQGMTLSHNIDNIWEILAGLANKGLLKHDNNRKMTRIHFSGKLLHTAVAFFFVLFFSDYFAVRRCQQYLYFLHKTKNFI